MDKPKPHNRKTPNPDNNKKKNCNKDKHTKITRITKGSERKMVKVKQIKLRTEIENWLKKKKTNSTPLRSVLVTVWNRSSQVVYCSH